MKAHGFIGLSVALVLAAVLTGAIAVYRPDKTIRVVTGLAAHTLCAESFVSGFDPGEIYAQTIAPYPGVRLLAPHMHYVVDRARREVRVDIGGVFASRAVWRGTLGCLLIEGSGPVDEGRAANVPRSAPLLPEIAGGSVVVPSDPALGRALDRIFAEPAAPPHRWVKAVVVVYDGRIIAERYAPGVQVDTPLLGYSASKSFINALVGILVREGRLKVDAPAPVPAWSGPGDPRRAITLDNLLRMTSGLAIAETGSGFDPAARMLYTERDMAGFAERQPLAEKPGTSMEYSDASTLIVSRIVRDAVGGTGAAVQNFAHRELFAPLGMKSVVLEPDATGTPVGSTHILATARDWARLGLLYLNDGVAGGRRILPEGWVRYSSRSTLRTSYAAGFWTNAGTNDEGALGRISAGVPCDTFFASGNLGQRVYIIPSHRLVIARLGVTQWPDYDIGGDNRFIRAVIATLPPAPPPACGRLAG
ncbi:MAG TPA: serine hydrolase [Rhizomicrobium sp.]|nr:serine hydrolase [Rhizomicrobium sp.]